jgi:hypothetical protein
MKMSLALFFFLVLFPALLSLILPCTNLSFPHSNRSLNPSLEKVYKLSKFSCSYANEYTRYTSIIAETILNMNIFISSSDLFSKVIRGLKESKKSTVSLKKFGKIQMSRPKCQNAMKTTPLTTIIPIYENTLKTQF